MTNISVQQATTRIAPFVRTTPLLSVSTQLHFKLEYLQLGGVFKTRGAFNVLLEGLESSRISRQSGVVIASGGNAALATAIAASKLDVACAAFVPETAPQAKLSKLVDAGAQIFQVGTRYQESFEAAQKFAVETGAFLSHAYDNPEVVSGAGTIGSEILAQLPSVDTILVSCGGGGLYAGVQNAVGHDVTVIPVEPENCATLTNALDFGSEFQTSVSGIAADSLGATTIGSIAFETAQKFDAQPLLVSEEAIAQARSSLWRDFKIISETGAAAAYAALNERVYVPEKDEVVCVLICGANTSLTDL